ncbi:MAG: ammonium transporter [Thermoproteus sp. AZ2]|jgi:Amt family ammonium transporter|uniref:Ammonium transporter n=1 Tax=Thermoproteus sp. AZ2 TaxID=1609232 RepID=A0ACC6UY20_9CREN|nr:MAG: ammonium transporter [Thermoproteus sp. AZ2]
MQVDVEASIWTTIGGVLVFLMIPAIGMLEAGLIRRKNLINGLMKGLLAVMIFLPIWFAVFPLYFSRIIVNGYLPTGQDVGVPEFLYAFFLGVFGAVTLALIYAGAPERLKFGGWVIFSIFFSAIQWPLVASWIWGDGFLYNLGSLTGLAPGLGLRDFAGGTVVHAYAGLAGAMAVLALGPTLRRLADRYESEVAYKEAVEAKNVDLQLAIIGTVLLFFGWFGFNGGSTLSMDVQTEYAVTNTAIAGALAGFVSMLAAYFEKRTWDAVATIGGTLGGLVAITPLAGFIDIPFSYLVGVAAGLVTYYGTKLVERWYTIDDPVGGLPAHGFNGIMGSMLVPILADPNVCGMAGLIYGGSLGWVLVQWMGMAIALGFVVATTYAMFKLLVALGFRASREEEIVGLDAVDHGVLR